MLGRPERLAGTSSADTEGSPSIARGFIPLKECHVRPGVGELKHGLWPQAKASVGYMAGLEREGRFSNSVGGGEDFSKQLVPAGIPNPKSTAVRFANQRGLEGFTNGKF